MARWLQPELLPWTAYFGQWLGRDPHWLAAHPGVPPRRHDRWRLGALLPFAAYNLHSLQVSRRVKAYPLAHAQLRPHRLAPPAASPPAERLLERLLYNEHLCGGDGKPLGGGDWGAWAEAGVLNFLFYLP